MSGTGTGQALAAVVHRALRAYHDDAALGALERLPHLRLVQARVCGSPGLSVPTAIRTVLDAGIDSLARADPLGADLLVRHFIRGEAILHIASALRYSESALYMRQRQAVAGLAAAVWETEEQLRTAPLDNDQRAMLDALPPPTFSRLFGVTRRLADLLSFVCAPDSPWLVAVDGLGGVGKTALARAAVEDLICEGRLQRVFWLTAQQRSFAWGRTQVLGSPALTYEALLDDLAHRLGVVAERDIANPQSIERAVRRALQAQPTLLVVDNLETAVDVQALVEGLDRLSRPTKVLFTTRHRVTDFEQVTSVTLHALPGEDALAFLHYHARERNITAILQASSEDLFRIAHVTGGNPLAIKLVAGQATTLPLSQILADLAAARTGAREFYRYIFDYSWKQLTDAAQRLLLHLPILDVRGATYADLLAVANGRDDTTTRAALKQLVDFSLVNVGYSQGQLLYSIHRLTERFIVTDLVGRNWADDEVG